METILSGIRPTGNLHIGNYFGAITNFLKLQETHNCYFFIADYHSLTTHPTPQNLHDSVKQVFVEYLAVGLDPEKATLYIQSDLPETIELYLFLNMNAYLGELMRCTSFKEKARKQPNNVNAGLLTYPTLMAADILIHRASKVPVGKDQEQHLEMARDYATRFNRLYNIDFFPEPLAYNFGENLVKVPGLDGTGKMGKSEGNAIYLIDTPEIIRKKVMKAVTDSGPVETNQPKSDAVANLFALMSIASKPDTISFFEEAYQNCTIRYGDMKKQLAEDIIVMLEPIREKINDMSKNTAYISKMVQLGREKAKASAVPTINQVREIIGFKSF
jgi:tryptophanyl-tRNA synthetase